MVAHEVNTESVTIQVLSWDGHAIAWQSLSGGLMSHECESVAQWPALPEIDADIARIYLPMEWLLSRFIQTGS